ncbi:MAG: MBL fold metallo-hydrolase [Pseudomonadota bacterium]
MTGIDVTFWGTRGTLPAPGPQFQHAGGNTNCIEVTCGTHTIVIDAGTGLRQLGSNLITQRSDQVLHMLLTHAHYDHVEGVPFFAPFFEEDRKLDIYCGELDGSSSTKETVLNLMRRPYFPVGPDVFAADVSYNDIKSGDSFDLSDEIKVSTVELNHPGGATGYRIDYEGKSFACITDTEHIPGKPDEGILELIEEVDLFIYDCSLTDVELPEFEGYGHSSFEEGMRLCKRANAGSFRAFHHMPFRTDSDLEAMEKAIKHEMPESGVAREGDVISIK